MDKKIVEVCLTESEGDQNSLLIDENKNPPRRAQQKPKKAMNLLIGTCNIKLMTTDEKVHEVEGELTNIKWAITSYQKLEEMNKIEYS